MDRATIEKILSENNDGISYEEFLKEKNTVRKNKKCYCDEDGECFYCCVQRVIKIADAICQEFKQTSGNESEEIDRYSKRDGNAKIQLLCPTESNPFNMEDLEIVDFGVADNIYVCQHRELSKFICSKFGSPAVPSVEDIENIICNYYTEPIPPNYDKTPRTTYLLARKIHEKFNS